jgi:monoamine oxidase
MIQPSLNTGSNIDISVTRPFIFCQVEFMKGFFRKPENIIIVGAGAAGLMAARELLKEGYIVTVLEASDRLGGRIQTIRDSRFKFPVEKGVEFIHGDLPLTIQLLKEAAIRYTHVKGEMIRIVNGEWKKQDEFAVGWDELIQQLNQVRDDETVNDFLNKNFADKKYDELRNSVLRFAQGFDLADPAKASILSLREEWMEEGEQYRIPGGYDQFIDYLENQCRHLGGFIYTSSVVKKIVWQKNDVTVVTKDEKKYYGHKVIVTASLGILQNDPPVISFYPAISDHIIITEKIGFGSVIKVLLEFKEAFWEEKKKKIGFLFTDEMIPTWWTQYPSSYPLLTGWAGGPQSWPLENKTDEDILQLALRSLSNIFKRPVDELKQLLTASLVANWRNDLYSSGAYSYNTIGSKQAQKFFDIPIDDTVFFAGEAFYDGSSPGTVEAALVSAKNVADKIMSGES